MAGEFVHHQLGGGERFQCAVSARRAAVDGARCNRGRSHVGLRKIVDRLCRGSAHHGQCNGAICPAAPIGDDTSAERLYAAALALDRHGVAHAELVTLQPGLELVEPVIGEPHRPAVTIKRGEQTVVRHGAMILRAIADGEARVQEQTLHADAAGCQHGRGALRYFLRRLRRHDKVQLLLPGIVPAVGIIGLQRRGIARLSGVVARQHQPLRGWMRDLVRDGVGVVHALRADVAVARGFRPNWFMLLVSRGKPAPVSGRKTHPRRKACGLRPARSAMSPTDRAGAAR